VQVPKLSELSLTDVKMLLDFFERLPLCLRQKKCRRDEIDDGATREHKKHRAVTVFADGWQEQGRDGRRDGLIDEQRDAHAIGTDARGHQLGKCQPDADTGPQGKESHERKHAKCHEPAVFLGRHGADKCALYF